jgi:hypothetical protein
MRWAPGILFVVLVVVAAAAAAITGHTSRSDVAAAPPASAPASPLPPPAIGSQWRYTAPAATASSGAGAEACARSQTDIEVGGGRRSWATLCLRRGGGYPYTGSILLSDTKGRFVCPACAVKARFDHGAALSFDGTAVSADGAGYALFIRDGAGLARDLKRASTASFVLTIEGAGEEAVTFNVAGLRWSR